MKFEKFKSEKKTFKASDFQQIKGTINFEVSADTGDSADKHPIKMLARTNDPVSYMGFQIVHDFAGMNRKNTVPIDYRHDSDQIIGYLDQFNLDDAGLSASGYLVPFSGKENDPVAELIHKAKAGVPYEASISAEPQEFIDLPEGMELEANGRIYTGPMIVFKNWNLRAVALTPHGADFGTITNLSNDDREISVIVHTPEAPAEEEAAVVEEAVVELSQETDLNKGPLVLNVEPGDKVVFNGIKAEPAPVELEKNPEIKAGLSVVEMDVDPLASLKLYVETFGNQAAQWLLEKKSFADCTKLALGELTEKLAHKDKVIADLEKRLADVKLGESEPVTFSAVEVEQVDKKFAHLGPGLSTFAAKIKLPK